MQSIKIDAPFDPRKVSNVKVNRDSQQFAYQMGDFFLVVSVTGCELTYIYHLNNI